KRTGGDPLSGRGSSCPTLCPMETCRATLFRAEARSPSAGLSVGRIGSPSAFYRSAISESSWTGRPGRTSRPTCRGDETAVDRRVGVRHRAAARANQAKKPQAAAGGLARNAPPFAPASAAAARSSPSAAMRTLIRDRPSYGSRKRRSLGARVTSASVLLDQNSVFHVHLDAYGSRRRHIRHNRLVANQKQTPAGPATGRGQARETALSPPRPRWGSWDRERFGLAASPGVGGRRCVETRGIVGTERAKRMSLLWVFRPTLSVTESRTGAKRGRRKKKICMPRQSP